MFPTSGEIDSCRRLLRTQGVGAAIRALRPDLDGRTIVDEGFKTHVRIELPPDVMGYARAVVVAQARHERGLCWFVTGVRGLELITQAWPLGTKDDHLAAAASALWDACLHDRELETPWRWAEAETSETVQLADALTAHGLTVFTAVAAENRLVPHLTGGGRDPVKVEEGRGHAIRLENDWCVATLWRKPTLGWVLDAYDHFETRRLPLPVSSEPPATDRGRWMRDVAAAIADALAQAWEDQVRHKRQVDSWTAMWPVHEAVAWWLAELGLGHVDVREDDRGRPEFRGDVQPLLTERCGLSELQRAFANATVARRRLIAFGTAGFTRDATRWACEAGVLAFRLGREADGFPLGAVTHDADEFIAGVI